MIQQLRRPERVGYGDGGGGGGAAARDLGQHAGVRVGGEFETTVFLRDDHREEAARLEVIPHLRRQVTALVSDVPIVEHAAQLFAGSVDECLLFGGQLRGLGG